MPTSKPTCGSFRSVQPFKVITHHPLGFLPTFLHSPSLGISLAVPLVPLKWCFPLSESILCRACSWPRLPVMSCCYGLYSTCFLALQTWMIFLCFFKVYLDMLQKFQYLCPKEISSLQRILSSVVFTMALLSSQFPKQDI